MAGNRPVGTKCEQSLRVALIKRELVFKEHARDLPGTPDFVFPDAFVAVFCDGDFWHGRNWEERKQKLEKGNNAKYWVPKIQSNIDRDRLIDEQLRELGWMVIRIWESKILERPDEAVDRVVRALRGKRTKKRSIPH